MKRAEPAARKAHSRKAAQFVDYMKADTADRARVIKAANIKPDSGCQTYAIDHASTGLE